MTPHKSRICNFHGNWAWRQSRYAMRQWRKLRLQFSDVKMLWTHEFKGSSAIDTVMQLSAPVIFLAQQFRACNWKLYRITSSSFLMQIRPTGKASSQFFRSPRRRPMFRRKSFIFATVMSAEKILCWKIQMWTFSFYTTAVAHRWCKHSD